MATIQKTYNSMGLPMNIIRGNPIPIDSTELWYSKAEAEAYASSDPRAYVGQSIRVIDESAGSITEYTISTNGTLIEHNTSATAHGDIRALIAALSKQLTDFLDVDEETVDQLSEVLELINNLTATDVGAVPVDTYNTDKATFATKAELNPISQAASNAETKANSLESRLDGIVASGGEPNTINTIKVNGTALTVDEQKAVNISIPTGTLAAKDAVSEAELETTLKNKLNSMVDENELSIAISAERASTNTELNKKVDKETGKGLSTNDFTDTYKEQLDGLSDALANKQATITGAATTIVSDDLTTDKVLVSDTSGKVNTSSVTSTELGYLSGVTSNIQNQLDGKSKVAASTSNGKIKIDGTDTKVYELPTASSTVLGGVKVGDGLTVTDGVLSTTGGGTADAVEWSNVKNKPSTVSGYGISDAYEKNEVDAAITAIDAKKVDKETGKGLSSNDYTKDDQRKVQNMSSFLSDQYVFEDQITFSDHVIETIYGLQFKLRAVVPTTILRNASVDIEKYNLIVKGDGVDSADSWCWANEGGPDLYDDEYIDDYWINDSTGEQEYIHFTGKLEFSRSADGGSYDNTIYVLHTDKHFVFLGTGQHLYAGQTLNVKASFGTIMPNTLVTELAGDTMLSKLSTKPVQNKVIANELSKIDKKFSLANLCAKDDGEGIITLFFQANPAGLYKAGSRYSELISTWSELIENNRIAVDNGEVFSNKNIEGELLLPDDANITKIGELSNHLSAITIPDSVEAISDYAFYGNDLAAIDIPDSVTAIGEHAFYLNPLREVVFGENSKLETIGAHAFENAILNYVKIPASVSSIGAGAFAGCSYIEIDGLNDRYFCVDNCLIDQETSTLVSGGHNSIIPADGHVTIIGESAFANSCNSKEISKFFNVTIPETVTQIGASAFSGIRPYYKFSMHIPSSVATIGEGAFRDSYIHKLTFEQNSQLKTINNSAFFDTSIDEMVVLPDGLTTIGASAFEGLFAGIPSIVIPTSVTSIGSSAFGGSMFGKCGVIYYKGTEADWTAKFGSGEKFGAKKIEYNYVG